MKTLFRSIFLSIFLPYSLWAMSCPSYFTVRDIEKTLIEYELLGGYEGLSYQYKPETKPYLTYSYKENYQEGDLYLIQNVYNYTITSLEEIDDNKYKVKYNERLA